MEAAGHVHRVGTVTRVAASVVAFVFTLTYGSGGMALAEAASRQLAARRAVASLDAQLAAQRKAAEQKRKAAVAEMRRQLGPDPAKVARLKSDKARIEAVHPNARLEGLAGQLEALAREPNPSASRLQLTGKLLDAALKDKNVAHSPKLAAALKQGKTQLAKAMPAKGAKVDVAKLKSAVDAHKPSLGAPNVTRSATLQFPKREPRLLPPGMHGALSPALRELYAQAGDAWVETPQGRVPAWQLAAGADLELPGVAVASMSDAVPLLQQLDEGTLSPPTADDLAETPEVKLTSDIRALASKLGGSPLALFNWVHDHVESETYYGSKKGAAGALAELRGNDFDQSSLLIALLRASGIPARYEYATVDLSPAQAMELAGATDIHAAAQIILSQGVPGTEETAADGSVTGIQVERAFVRAYVPYGDYRGTGAGGHKLWVRLDPGMKRHVLSVPTLGRGLVSFSYASYLSAPQANTPLELYQSQLVAAAKTKNLCDTVDALLTRRTIIADDFKLLPAEHPARSVSPLMVFSTVPASMRFTVSYALNGDTYTTSLPELYGHKVTLRYVGDTSADQQAITSAGAIANLSQPYSVTVDGSLRLDGAEVHRFPGDNPGTPETLTLSLNIPGNTPDVVDHAINSGGVYALKMSPDLTPDSAAQNAASAVNTAVASGDALDDIDEARAVQALELYTNEFEADQDRVFGLQGYVQPRVVTNAVAGRFLDASWAYGLPVSLHRADYQIDVTYLSVPAIGLDGNTAHAAELTKLAGYQGSTREHLTWEQMFHNVGVSSVKALQGANISSDAVLNLTSSTQLGQLTGYSQTTLDAVTNALGQGQTVTIAQHPVTYKQYSGVEAYIALDPNTGAGEFALGLLGTTMHPTLNGGGDSGPQPANGPGGGCACCAAGTCGQMNSEVRFSDGDHQDSFVDLTLPNPGLPLVLSRAYRSRSSRLTTLGYGWVQSYGVFLDVSAAPSRVTFVNETALEVGFTSSGTNAWKSDAQWHQTLSFDGSQYHLRFKDGLVYTFDASGKLLTEADPNGNTLALAYDGSGRLQTVSGGGGATLTYAYDAQGKLATVTDSAARVVTYRHDVSGTPTDDLTQVDDVLGKSERYGYDGKHNLASVTDKDGNTKLSFYDLDDRWIGSVDAAGNADSAAYDDLHNQAAVTDRNGNTKLYTWNAAGNPTAITDPQGNTTTMQWDGSMNQTSKTDGSGTTFTYGYDGNGNQTQVNAPLTYRISSTFDATYSRLTKRTQGNETSSYVYDSHGNLTQATDPMQNVTSYTYTAQGQPATITQVGTSGTSNAVTTLGYDARGNLTTLVDPTDGGTSLGYDSAGHLTSIQDPVGNSRSMQVDARGQVQTMTDGLGRTSRFFYDDQGNRTLTLDATDAGTSFGYDALNRVTSVTDATGRTSSTEYDAMGNVTARVDANGDRTEYSYDSSNRLIETKNADGSVTSLGYCADRASSPCQMVDALGNVTTFNEDSLGRTTSTVDALGHSSAQHFDNYGNVNQTTDQNNNGTSYNFDNLNRITTLYDPQGSKITYGYDNRGNRTSVVRWVGSGYQDTYFGYDAANRLIQETTPVAFNTTRIVTSYTYDAAGNRKTKTDGKLGVTSYDYDGNRRLKAVHLPDGSSYAFDYDARGNRILEKHLGSDGTTVIHERDMVYDALNRLQQTTDATLNKRLDYTYDATGNRASVTVTDLASSAVESSYSYRYDAMNRLAEVIEGDGDTTELRYDAAGNRAAVIYGNGMTATYGYDAANRLTSIAYKSAAGQVLQSFTYVLDPAGNRLSKAFANGTGETYAYDAANRLYSYTDATGAKTGYALNGYDQITSSNRSGTGTGYTWNAFNQLVQLRPGSDTINYAFDGNGNLISANSTQHGATAYKYDGDNRMTEVDLPAGGIDTYAYDANGLRISKTDSTGTTHYLLDGPSVIAEYNGTTTLTEQHNNNPQRIDEQFDLVEGGTKLWPITDGLGSVYAWVDRSGSVVGSYSYDVYGARTQTSGSVNVAWGYTGREHDADTGLNYNRDRYLAPGLATWTQPDRLAEAAGNSKASIRSALAPSGVPFSNVYNYASNPVSGFDPYGLLLFYFGQSASGSIGWAGAVVSYGEVIGFSDEEVAEAQALTVGFTFSLGVIYSVGVTADAAVFPELNNIQDFTRWFIQGSLNIGVPGSVLGGTMGLIWSLDTDKLAALKPLNKVTFQDLASAMGDPIGYAYSAGAGPGLGFFNIAGYSVSASFAITYSWVLLPASGKCNHPWGGGLPPGVTP